MSSALLIIEYRVICLYAIMPSKNSMGSNKKLSFGPEATMPEVPKGMHAELEFSETGDLEWEHKEDGEYGLKYFIPIVLFKHPSIESLSSSGSAIRWATKCNAGETLFNIVVEGTPLRKEIFGKTWKLERSLTGGYRLNQK